MDDIRSKAGGATDDRTGESEPSDDDGRGYNCTTNRDWGARRNNCQPSRGPDTRANGCEPTRARSGRLRTQPKWIRV